jgi:hypothetical protein
VDDPPCWWYDQATNQLSSRPVSAAITMYNTVTRTLELTPHGWICFGLLVVLLLSAGFRWLARCTAPVSSLIAHPRAGFPKC